MVHSWGERPSRLKIIIFMKVNLLNIILATTCLCLCTTASSAVLYEVTSPYHHIKVVEQAGMRTLCFDDSTQTRISIDDPLKGHFEYTEFFHMPWLWNTNIQRVLMVGLGGGSAQTAYEKYYPKVSFETVEIDPAVLRVARQYFRFAESGRQKVFVEDGRLFLRRNASQYDVILMDAYVQGRYGSSIPQHLATREFFDIVKSRLTTNGVVAYNVIGSMAGWQGDIVGAIYRTMQTVFPNVYSFPARSSQNVVLLATVNPTRADLSTLRATAQTLVKNGSAKLPTFSERVNAFQVLPPRNVGNVPILTDDYAPVEGLAGGGGK